MDQREIFLQNLEKLHSTELGRERIRRNLSLDAGEEVVRWCREQVSQPSAQIRRQGKNWYITTTDCVLTIHAHSFTIITAHKNTNFK